MYWLAAIILIVLILIAWVKRGARYVGFEMENMIAAKEEQVDYLLKEVDWDNARVENCFGGLEMILEPAYAGIIQPGINDADVAVLKSLLKSKMTRLQDLKNALKNARNKAAELREILKIPEYINAPDAALHFEDDLARIGAEIDRIKIEMERTRNKIKTVEDQIMVVNGEVPYNHYNNYFNVCYHSNML
jgi:hypothetical protein